MRAFVTLLAAVAAIFVYAAPAPAPCFGRC
jgi:hypothetical protein